MSEASPGNRDGSSGSGAVPSAASRSRNRSNNERGGGNARSLRFQGACDAIKEHVYDTSTHKGSGTELFTKTTRSIAEYVAAEYKDAGEFRLALPNLEFEPLIEPVEQMSGVSVDGDPVMTRRDERIWDLQYQQYLKDLNSRKKNMGKVFALILGQCATSVRDKIEADESWQDVNDSSDPIELLKLIRTSIYQRGTSRKATHAYIEASRALELFHQGDKMPNHLFLARFKELVEVFEHLGGEPGTSQALIEPYIMKYARDPEFPTDQEQADAIMRAREQYLAILFLFKADKKRYGSLLTDIQND